MLHLLLMMYARRAHLQLQLSLLSFVTLWLLGHEPKWNIMRHGTGNERPEGGEKDDAVILQS